MAINVEKINKPDGGGLFAEFEFSVSADEFKAAVDKAYRKMVGSMSIPGFRKGKAPKVLIEKTYGEGVFYEEAVNIILPDAYEKALEETGLDPVAHPEIDIKEIDKDTGVIFTASVALKPEFELAVYKGVEVEKVQYKVLEKDVKEELEKMREKNSRLITIDDRAVKNGDITTIDFEGFSDGIAFAGGKGENHELTIGSGQFIPGFEEQLIGKKIGDDVEVNVTFPEEYQSEDLAGKEAMFRVKIHQIKVKELPKLDDEFAKDISEFDTLAELKASIKKKMKEANENKAKNELENNILDKIADGTLIEIPEVMIESRIESLIRDFEMQMRYQGMNLDMYLQYTGSTMEQMKEQMRSQAEKQVKTSLILEKIAKEEKIKAKETEIDAEYQKIMTDSGGMSLEDIKKYVPQNDIESTIQSRKTVELLVKEAILK